MGPGAQPCTAFMQTNSAVITIAHADRLPFTRIPSTSNARCG